MMGGERIRRILRMRKEEGIEFWALADVAVVTETLDVGVQLRLPLQDEISTETTEQLLLRELGIEDRDRPSESLMEFFEIRESFPDRPGLPAGSVPGQGHLDSVGDIGFRIEESHGVHDGCLDVPLRVLQTRIEDAGELLLRDTGSRFLTRRREG